MLRCMISDVLPDRLDGDIRLLLCGINPGRHSAAQGHHYAGPGNRFWPALHRAGLTPEPWTPERDVDLPALGIGLTNLVGRWSARADELAVSELRHGGERLVELARRIRPRVVAVLGVVAYRQAFQQPSARVGDRRLLEVPRGSSIDLRVLPNPSGLNAHFSLDHQAEMLAEAGRAAGLL